MLQSSPQQLLPVVHHMEAFSPMPGLHLEDDQVVDPNCQDTWIDDRVLLAATVRALPIHRTVNSVVHHLLHMQLLQRVSHPRHILEHHILLQARCLHLLMDTGAMVLFLVQQHRVRIKS